MDKIKAKEFVERWSGRGNEDEETQLFWIELLQDVLGGEDVLNNIQFEKDVITPRSETPGHIDVLLPSARVLIEQKSLGVDLDKPELRQKKMVTPLEQAIGYMDGIPVGRKPYYLVTCNFEEMRVYETRKHGSLHHNPDPDITIKLEEIPSNLGTLQFLLGDNHTALVEAKKVSVEAGRIMGKIHDAVAEQFIDPNTEESHHALSVFCTRIMFLMFCEDAGLIGPNVFTNYLQHYDAVDTRKALLELFEWLDTSDSDRDPYANELLKAFPYMNGGLFRERTQIPTITENIRTTIIVNGCMEFDWSGVDPTVFGSIFEGALSHDERRSGGMHYTSPENTHKVIDPLFLDDLREEFNVIKSKPTGGGRTRSLNNFHKKIGNLVFLDPAAGSGNFLTETYKCLRELENQILFELAKDGQTSLEFEELDEVDNSVLVTLQNFHGIEINDFACCVARTALWIAEKQADIKTEYIVKRVYQALPLKDYEGIIHANSLRIDWNDVVSFSDVDYIMGNPPFIGAYGLTSEQKKDRIELFGKKNSKILDYVACWFMKSAQYIKDYDIKVAFVATNSICQGQQVQPLWEPIFDAGLEIEFAYRPFVWSAQTDDIAHVHVVIVGLSKNPKRRVIYSNGLAYKVNRINGYLIDAPTTFILKRNKPICDVSPMAKGFQPTDHGYLQLSEEQKNEFIRVDSGYEQWIRKFSMGSNFIDGSTKYCLWLPDITPKQLFDLPLIRSRVESCRNWRASQIATGDAYKLKDRPHLFRPANKFKDKPYIAIPETSSERRKYVPMGFVTDGMIPGNALRFVADGTLYEFGIMISQFHNAWMRVVAGRLEMRYRYSNTIVYNNFVWPEPTEEQKNAIENYAQDVLDARESYEGCSLADMYDPDNEFMFPELFNAHKALDKAVEEAYGVEFNGDEEKIVAHLFKLYEEKTKE